jgi:hypothetical protein
MVIPAWLEQRSREDAYLRDKVQLIRARLEALDSRFDAAFWSRIYADSDAADRYGFPARESSTKP